MEAITVGVPFESASSADDRIPLPYCNEPINAAAEPAMSSGTSASAAEVAQAVMIPFMLKTKNIGTTIPQIPINPVIPSIIN